MGGLMLCSNVHSAGNAQIGVCPVETAKLSVEALARDVAYI